MALCPTSKHIDIWVPTLYYIAIFAAAADRKVRTKKLELYRERIIETLTKGSVTIPDLVLHTKLFTEVQY